MKLLKTLNIASIVVCLLISYSFINKTKVTKKEFVDNIGCLTINYKYNVSEYEKELSRQAISLSLRIQFFFKQESSSSTQETWVVKGRSVPSPRTIIVKEKVKESDDDGDIKLPIPKSIDSYYYVDCNNNFFAPFE